jgi:Uma2 family endonuclease
MNKTAQLLTAEDLLAMPGDGMRYELVKGEVRTMPPGGSEHGAVGIRLSTPLAQHVEAHRLGVVFGAETGFILSRDPDTVRAPDIAFVRQERIPRAGLPKTYWPGAPDLAVEIMSPSDRVFEVDEKVEEWLVAGTKMVWVVNPRQRTVTVYRPDATPVVLSKNDQLDGQDIVPGFSRRVADTFV